MSDVILRVENLSKQYRLGAVGTGTISHDLNRWWHKIRGMEDPYLKIGETNDRSKKGESDYAWALRDINFEVKRGEVLGIIGKNGAGKSTLLKILSRVTSPTTGEIKTKGRIASLLEVGTGFHPELTGRENIYLNGAILGMTKAEIKGKEQEIIEFSGCERYIDTPVKRYSSGMRVRLAFAVAAHLEPDILVVDEVLAVGDAEFQKKAIGKMQDISRGEGRTVLFVSHDMAAIKTLCDRCIVLNNGEVSFDGMPDKSINFYINSKDVISRNDISQIKDRKGLGDFKIIKIKNVINPDSDTYVSGNILLLEITISNLKKQTVKDFQLDFGLNDSRSTRISWFSTSIFDKKHIYSNSETIVIYFKIDKLPLNEGSYSLTSNLIINNIPQDWVENVFSFDVCGGAFFESGKMIPLKQGNFLINHEFNTKCFT